MMTATTIRSFPSYRNADTITNFRHTYPTHDRWQCSISFWCLLLLTHTQLSLFFRLFFANLFVLRRQSTVVVNVRDYNMVYPKSGLYHDPFTNTYTRPAILCYHHWNSCKTGNMTVFFSCPTTSLFIFVPVGAFIRSSVKHWG